MTKNIEAMTAGNQPSSSDTNRLRQCRFCEKPPGSKVGPPAMARCITPGCDGTKLAAETIPEWNARNLVESTCYVERSKVREILLSRGIESATLAEIDTLTIFVADDFRPPAQAPKVTDEMCEAAIKADSADRIQGFTYTKRHVIRDVWKSFDEQNIWEICKDDADAEAKFHHQCQIERMRKVLEAALALPSTEGK